MFKDFTKLPAYSYDARLMDVLSKIMCLKPKQVGRLKVVEVKLLEENE